MNKHEADELADEIRRQFGGRNPHYVIDIDVVKCINGEWKIEII